MKSYKMPSIEKLMKISKQGEVAQALSPTISCGPTGSPEEMIIIEDDTANVAH